MKENLFHLLVTADTEAWENGLEEYPIGRFLEYTVDDIASRFEGLSETNIKELKSFPCLCAYEGDHDLRVGRITDIQVEGSLVRVYVQIDQSMNPIPHKEFYSFRREFNVHSFEFSRTHWALKSGNLIEKLKEHSLLPQSAIIPLPDTELTGKEIAGTISSVTEFIDLVIELQSAGEECFYRGHSDEKYLLKPTIFRTDKETGAPLYKDVEYKMFREILIANSFDFRDDNSTLDRLVRMQHHSLPTRLLDITANPLIALFFSVWSEFENKKEQDGEVILFFPSQNKIKYFDSDTASCIANLARMSDSERDEIDFTSHITQGFFGPVTESEKFDFESFNAQPSILKLLHYIGGEKPYFKPRIIKEDLRSVICVKSKRSNNRISSQSGAFFLFGHEATLSENGSDEIQVKRIKIKNKPSILKDLELLNITEGSVYPHIEYSARDIARRYMAKPDQP